MKRGNIFETGVLVKARETVQFWKTSNSSDFKMHRYIMQDETVMVLEEFAGGAPELMRVVDRAGVVGFVDNGLEYWKAVT